MPVSRIKVVPMEIGGGFGGKIRVYLEPVAAVLSRKTGRPVKLVMNRAEVFEATGPTPGSYIRVKMGADAPGGSRRLRPTWPTRPARFPARRSAPGRMCVFACYDIPNVLIDGYDVVVNKPATSAYRAPGATNAAFAAETVIDEICEQLKHRSARVPPQERRPRGDAPRRRAGLSPHRHDRDRRGCQERTRITSSPSRLDHPGQRISEPGVLTAAHQARSRRGIGFLVQHRLEVERHGQRQRRRHGQPGRRIDRHRRHAHSVAMQLAEALGIRRRRRSPRRRRHRDRSATPTSPAAAG